MPGLNLFAGAHETAFGLSIRNIAPPAPTTGPSFYPNALGIRQDDATPSGSETEVILETCAWFSHTVSSLGWEALHCEDPCTTSGTLFGCEVIPETCLDYEQDVCQATVVEAGCCDTTFPYCITGVLEQDGNTFTAFRCGNEALSGEMPLYVDTSATLTTVVSSDGDEPSTITVIETPTEEPTKDSSPTDETKNPGDTDDQTKDEGDDQGSSDGGGGGGAPIGAIVGGVIGGIALIVGVAFAIWFIHFQKKKHANKATDSGMEPYRYDPSAAYAGGGYSQQQGGYDYSQGGYNNQGQYGMGPLPPTFSQAGGSPKPGEQVQMQQAPPAEMPEYSNYGTPSELPSEGTTAGRR